MSSGGSYSGIAAGGAADGVAKLGDIAPQVIDALTNRVKGNISNLLTAQDADQKEYDALSSQDITGLDGAALAARQQKLQDLTGRMTGRQTQFDALQKSNPIASHLTQGLDSKTLFSPRFTLEQDKSRLGVVKTQYDVASSNRQSAESDLQTALKDQTSSPERITMLKARLRAADEALSGIAGKLGVPFQANNPVYADLTPQQYRQAQHQLDLGKTLDSASTAMQRTPAGAQLYATLQKKREEGNLTDDDLAQVVQYSDNDGLAAQVKDAYATGKLNVDTAAQVVTGIGAGCELSGCSLVGGETAEMPGMYEGEDYDLAGFSVGVVEHDNIIDGKKVQAGDVLIGLASSGAHSNGYSLIRKIIEFSGAALDESVGGKPLADVVMTPTRIYVKNLLQLAKNVDIHAMAHITGGGLPGNLPRVLPNGTRAVVNTKSWEWPALFNWLQAKGNVDTYEMYRTFNCGVGMIVVVAEADVQTTLDQLTAAGEKAWVMGHIEADAASTVDASDQIRVNLI